MPGQGNSLDRFVALCQGEGLERGQCCCLVSGGLASTCPISSHFTHFLFVNGALLAAALVMIHSVGGFAHILELCWPFKWILLRNRQFLLLPQPPLVFTGSSGEALSSQY